jgi:SET domain-containing protein
MKVIAIGSVIINLILILILIKLITSSNTDLCVEMKSSPVHGRGMFAKTRIQPDKLIEAAPLIFFNRDKDITPDSVIKRYDMNVNANTNAVMLGYASIYNHSDDHNAAWKIIDDKIYITSIKHIEPGQEVFVNYGPHYWSNKQGQKK